MFGVPSLSSTITHMFASFFEVISSPNQSPEFFTLCMRVFILAIYLILHVEKTAFNWPHKVIFREPKVSSVRI